MNNKKIQKSAFQNSYKLIRILMSEISIWHFHKTWLSTWYFVPLFFADPLEVFKVSRLTFGKSNLQLPPHIFYGIKVWRLARPLQDLNVLLLEPLLCCLGPSVLGHWNTHPRPIFNAQCPGWPHSLALMVHGPIHRPFILCFFHLRIITPTVWWRVL